MKASLFFILILAFSVIFLQSCSKQEYSYVTLISSRENVTFTVEIADTPWEQEQGLMHRTSLPNSHGMLFVFPTERNVTFWMKNTSIPLDMLFIDENFTITTLYSSVQSCLSDPCSLYPSSSPVKYVLEVNAGICEESNISVGDQMQILLKK